MGKKTQLYREDERKKGKRSEAKLRGGGGEKGRKKGKKAKTSEDNPSSGGC